MADTETAQTEDAVTDPPETFQNPRTDGRGWFAKKVKELDDNMARLAALVEGFDARIREMEEVGRNFKQEEIDFLWQNFEDMTEVVSALRRVNGFPPLAEFEGTRQRRRMKEKS